MMTISNISASSDGNPLAALMGGGNTGAADAGGFGGLFALLLADGKTLPETNPESLNALIANDSASAELDDNMLLQARFGLLSEENPFPEKGRLPDHVQALLRETGKHHARKTGDEDQDSPDNPIPILSLTPEIRHNTRADLPQNDARSTANPSSYSLIALARQIFLANREMTPSEQQGAQGTANFAANPENFSALLHSASPQGHIAAHPASAHAATTQNPPAPATDNGLQTPVQDPKWSQEFGEKIVWMARNDRQQAQLRLNPAHLGPLQITLSLDADKASATFTAATPEVRQAIEDALPRLREMLAGAGITLGDAQVDAQSRQEAFLAGKENEQNGKHPENERDNTAILDDDPVSTHMLHARHGTGLVNLFA